MQGAVGVVPSAVRVVRPRRIEIVRLERRVCVVAVIEGARGVRGVRRPLAHLKVGGEGGSAVGRERCPELCVVVGDAIGVAGTPGPQVVSGVVPSRSNIACRLIYRDGRVELAVLGGVVVQPDR